TKSGSESPSVSPTGQSPAGFSSQISPSGINCPAESLNGSIRLGWASSGAVSPASRRIAGRKAVRRRRLWAFMVQGSMVLVVGSTYGIDTRCATVFYALLNRHLLQDSALVSVLKNDRLRRRPLTRG